MTAPDDSLDDLLDPDASPIAGLQALLDGSGEEVAKGFGAALAGTKDEKQKLAGPERALVGW